MHKAVEVESQLHIIEELQVFEEQQPINNVVISAKQVMRLTVQTYDSCHTGVYIILSFPDKRVCGLSIRCSSASLRHLSQIQLLLRLHLCQRPSLCLERSTMCGHNGACEQVSAELCVIGLGDLCAAGTLLHVCFDKNQESLCPVDVWAGCLGKHIVQLCTESVLMYLDSVHTRQLLTGTRYKNRAQWKYVCTFYPIASAYFLQSYVHVCSLLTDPL